MSQFLSSFESNGKTVHFYNIKELCESLGADVSRLPFSLRVLLENLLRNKNGNTVTDQDLKEFCRWSGTFTPPHDINYHPARVVMQDFTGVPAVVDLASMRQAMKEAGGDANKINPLVPVDLVIDHSVMVDHFGESTSFEKNVDLEFERNNERYKFLKWGRQAFDNFRVVPPGTGIVHQVNIEYLTNVVWGKEVDGKTIAYPDTCVGTDSHTTMVNGLAVLGWGVGGIEAEAAMLGQPVTMLIPDVVGFELKGSLPEGATATDLVLTVVEKLRELGVVGKFVEFYGEGIKKLSLADRATISNMAPEYGATCGFFPIDEAVTEYLKLTGRTQEQIDLVESYAKSAGFWYDGKTNPEYTNSLSLDMETVVSSISGPKRPQDRIELSVAGNSFQRLLTENWKEDLNKTSPVEGESYEINQGDVVIAAITSCTNTSNPSVMIGAGLVAKKAREKGLKVKPWVKTSFAPGSQVVTEYMVESGLQQDLDAMGYNLVGYGCTTCIGNSGPLPTPIKNAVEKEDMVVTSVLSGNRNFEGRISPQVKANYLASPPLVVAYSILGNMQKDIYSESLGNDQNGNPVFLKDIWPSEAEIQEVMSKTLRPEIFKSKYANVLQGPKKWQTLDAPTGEIYDWDENSTYIQNPPFFEGFQKVNEPENIRSAKILAVLGDSTTTDHISPAGAIPKNGPAGKYLEGNNVDQKDFNSFGSRRGNHEVMMRGTFANIRIKNQMVPGTEGGYTKHYPSGEEGSIYDIAMKHKQDQTPLVVFGGKEYGTGSSRDWAAKGTDLLGVKAVVCESFERIHRSNLIGMGVLPIELVGKTLSDLKLKGDEVVSIEGIEGLSPRKELKLKIGNSEFDLRARIDTEQELEYYKSGGILRYVLKNLYEK